MEKFIPFFTRVQLGLDEASDLIARFDQLESAILSGDTNISPSDVLLILDRPSPASIANSIARLQSSTSSALDKAAIIRRALHTPTELSSDEIDLLRRRFWLPHEHDPSLHAEAMALEKLESEMSQEYVVSMFARLRRVREKLAGDEEKAIQAALLEWLRRLMSWKPSGYWGYAVYYHPDAGADDEDYQCRMDSVLRCARDVSAVAKNVQGQWKLHTLEWPAEAINEHKRDVFETLRKDFQTARDALPEGIFQNVFLVVDRDSVDSVWKVGVLLISVPDTMWVWAVDPEHRHRDDDAKDDGQEDQDTHTVQEQEQEPAEYPGYMRVRLQQLVHNFYEARRPDKAGNMVPLETIWACAQKSYLKAFVSMREEDFWKWVPSHDVGSCLEQ